MALTNSVKGDEIEKQENEVSSTVKPVKAVQEPTRSRTSQRKAATAAVNAMKEQALGARKAENEDDEGKPKRGGRGRPKGGIIEKASVKSVKNERKRAASSDVDDDDQPKSKRGRPKGKAALKKAATSTGRKSGRPTKASKEGAVKTPEEDLDNDDDDKAVDDKADESNSGEESTSKTE